MSYLILYIIDTPPIVVAVSPQFTLAELNSLFSPILLVKLKIHFQYYKHYCIYVNTFKQVFQSCSVFAWVFSHQIKETICGTKIKLTDSRNMENSLRKYFFSNI